MTAEEWALHYYQDEIPSDIAYGMTAYASYYHAEMSKWVRVEDRLPIQFTQEVLVWCKYGTEQPLMAWYNDKSKTWHVSTECTDAGESIERNDGTITGYTITHWQPLPPKPNEI